MAAKDDDSYLTCYICGCNGYNRYSKYIARCSKCGTFEHQYCMTRVHYEVPEDWTCHRCRPHMDASEVDVGQDYKKAVEARKKTIDHGKFNHVNPKKVALVAPELRTSYPRRSEVGVKRHLPDNQIGGEMPSKRFRYVEVKEEPTTELCSPEPVPSSNDLCPGDEKKSNGFLEFEHEVHEPVHSSKDLGPGNQNKLNTILEFEHEVHGKDLAVIPQDMMVEDKVVGQSPDVRKFDRSLSKKDLCSESSQSVAEAGQQTEKGHWKGTFNIHDPNWNVSLGIEAHLLKGLVDDKAYEVTKRLPKVVQLKLKPCENIWPKMFELQPPECTDIALYFHPDADCSFSSKRAYYSLLEKMDSEKLGIGCCIQNAYLLIFSSKKLSPALQQDKNGLTYFWGVFCRSKLLSRHSLAPIPAT